MSLPTDPRPDPTVSSRGGWRVIVGTLVIIAFAFLIGWVLSSRPPLPLPTPDASVAAAPSVEPALSIAVQPEQSVSGRQVRPAPSIVLTDNQGRPVAGAVVSASVEPSSFADGSVAEVTTDAEGRAVFDSLVLAQAGAYCLAFSSAGYDTARSSEFVVRFGIPRVLTMVREPTGGAAGAPLPGEPTVRVTDNAGNPVPGINVDAILETSGASADKLATAQTNAEGLAVFPDIVIPAPGSSYRLKFSARAAGINHVLSAPFDLTNS